MPGITQPILGALVILSIGYAFSTNRRAINWITVAWGLSLQIIFAFIVLKTSIGQIVFETVGGYITKLLAFAGVGAAFVFGPLGNASVWGRAMTVMTSGMAHISGGIMAAYIAFGIEARHLLTAVIMTAPGTIMMAKMLVPEVDVPKTMGSVKLTVERTDVNVIDAAGRGTSEGLHLALNVGAMLISFLALISLVNALLGHVPLPRGAGHLSL